MALWGGCFSAAVAPQFKQFGDSIHFDLRLAAVDIRGSIAYAEALERAEVITGEERTLLVDGLHAVLAEFAAGTFDVQSEDEDIHTAVERRLMETIGPVAGKLHTGRSRNDQVATDLRLYLLGEIEGLRAAIVAFQKALVNKAEQNLSVVMAGYTHLRPAQPVLFSHWLMSVYAKLERDLGRLDDLTPRVAVCPLGSGALSGTPYPIDRHALAHALGFEAPSANSLDAVEERDFVVEFLSWAALVQVHLSQMAETLILWSSHEVGFVRLAEAYSTGSSLMPQKRNPDPLELIRGKAGRLIGASTGLLCTLKGLPSGYNKDLQEDKEALFDAIDTLALELPLCVQIIRTLKINAAHMASACSDAMLATDLADYLVAKGIPFRESHRLVGEAVRVAERAGTSLQTLDLAAYQRVSPSFASDLYGVYDVRRAVAARSACGGTAPGAVRAQINAARDALGKTDDNTNPINESKGESQ